MDHERRHSDTEQPDDAATSDADAGDGNDAGQSPKPVEVGGPGDPEPTRYGDWEKAGRCIDF